MSEVIVRSLATSFCTVLPVLALLLFGGETLRDFAFALLVGIASGTYSSIFIASPVLTHWKERERVYVQRNERIRRESGGLVPAYAVATMAGEPIEVAPGPAETRRARRRGRLTAPQEPEEISREEFDDLVADLDVDDPRAVAPVPDRTPRVSSTGGARPAPKPKKDKDKPKRPRNRRHGRNR
jgi:SecD/SecF fusion protein